MGDLPKFLDSELFGAVEPPHECCGGESCLDGECVAGDPLIHDFDGDFPGCYSAGRGCLCFFHMDNLFPVWGKGK